MRLMCMCGMRRVAKDGAMNLKRGEGVNALEGEGGQYIKKH